MTLSRLSQTGEPFFLTLAQSAASVAGYHMNIAPPKNKPNIYLDHAAATPIDPEVLAAMQPFLTEHFGNPSALYSAGRTTKAALTQARENIAELLIVDPNEIIFTGSGTESDNMAILGIAHAARRAGKGSHIITSAIEHHAVLKACDLLEQYGFVITRLPVNETGRVTKQSLTKALRTDTILVSIMYANNEIGTIQPISELAEIAHKNGALFHTDACQAAGYLMIKPKKLGVDLMTLNSSKIYGPKGVGLLYVRDGIKIEPLIVGGAQETKLRAGTENVAAIVGFAKALELAEQKRESENARLTELRNNFIAEIKKRIPSALINGHTTERLPNNIHLAFPDISGESIVSFLDEFGVAAATGSACDSQSFEPSHVVVSLGLPFEYINGCLRLTLGRATTARELDYVAQHLPTIVSALQTIHAPVTAKVS